VKAGEDFFNLYNHEFVRAAVAVPRVRVADPAFNAREVIELMAQAAARRAVVVLFPELCLSAYSCEDLFHQGALIETCRAALGDATVAAPVLLAGSLFAVGEAMEAFGGAPGEWL